MVLLTFFSMTIRGIYKLENAFFMIFQKILILVIFLNIFTNKCSKIFAWPGFRSFPACMPIFSQIRDVSGTFCPKMVDSLLHPLLSLLRPIYACNKFFLQDDRAPLLQRATSQDVRLQLWILHPRLEKHVVRDCPLC